MLVEVDGELVKASSLSLGQESALLLFLALVSLVLGSKGTVEGVVKKVGNLGRLLKRGAIG